MKSQEAWPSALRSWLLPDAERRSPWPNNPAPPKRLPGVALRRMALSTPADNLGFKTDADFPIVYGVLTDWDIGGSVATIMSMRDGTASLYTTSEFGVIGGHSHERVRQAALR